MSNYFVQFYQSNASLKNIFISVQKVVFLIYKGKIIKNCNNVNIDFFQNTLFSLLYKETTVCIV